MSWADDTDTILADGLQDAVVTVKCYSSTFSTSSVYPVESSSTIETSTVNIFPESGTFEKEIKGRVIKSTHLIIFPATSSVIVGHRAYENGETDYHEVMDVRNYEGHKQAYTHKVEGR